MYNNFFVEEIRKFLAKSKGIATAMSSSSLNSAAFFPDLD